MRRACPRVPDGSTTPNGIVAALCAASVMLCAAAGEARAQPGAQPRAQPHAQPRVQFRADALVARTVAVQAGAGVETDAGLYARLGVVAGVGADGDGASARVEGVARFLLDPLRQARRGPYLGGGAGVQRDGRGDARAYLLAVIGVEGGGAGAARRGWAPAVELGLGGGARLAIVLRRTRPNAR